MLLDVLLLRRFVNRHFVTEPSSTTTPPPHSSGDFTYPLQSPFIHLQDSAHPLPSASFIYRIQLIHNHPPPHSSTGFYSFTTIPPHSSMGFYSSTTIPSYSSTGLNSSTAHPPSFMCGILLIYYPPPLIYLPSSTAPPP